MYFPLEDPIQVHQTRVKPCPQGFTAGFYWYGTKRKGPGRPPKWVERVLSDSESDTEGCVPDETSTSTSDGNGSSSMPSGSGCEDVSHIGDFHYNSRPCDRCLRFSSERWRTDPRLNSYMHQFQASRCW